MITMMEVVIHEADNENTGDNGNRNSVNFISNR